MWVDLTLCDRPTEDLRLVCARCRLRYARGDAAGPVRHARVVGLLGASPSAFLLIQSTHGSSVSGALQHGEALPLTVAQRPALRLQAQRRRFAAALRSRNSK